jgi:hypothetical protein
MALVSPGVEVNVIDESFYTPGTAGTTPMIFVASAENKQNSSGTGIARGTLKENARRPFLMTSQRDLADTFGDPLFQTDANNNPINGGELNEYGLQTAYSVLGVTNRAWVVRSDIDLAALQPTPNEPAGPPADGTYWLDTETTSWGIFEWNGAAQTQENGQTFVRKTPIVITNDNDLVFGTSGTNGTDGKVPKDSIGSIGGYAVVFGSTVARIFYKSFEGIWTLVGSDNWTSAWPTIVGTQPNPEFDFTDPSGEGTVSSKELVINGVTISVTSGMDLEEIVDEINSNQGLTNQGISADILDSRINIFSNGTSTLPDSTATGAVDIGGFTYGLGVELGLTEGEYFPPALRISKHTQIPEFKASDTQSRPTGSVWIKTTEPGAGARWRMKIYNDDTQLWEDVDAPIFASNQEAIYELDRAGGGTNLPSGAVYVQFNVADDTLPLATFKVYRRDGVLPTIVRGTEITEALDQGNSYSIRVSATQPGNLEFQTGNQINISFDSVGSIADDLEEFATEINNLGITGLSARVENNVRIVLEHSTGGDIKLVDDSSDAVLSKLGLSAYSVSKDPSTGAVVTSGAKNLYFAPGTDSSTDPIELVASLWNPTTISNGDQVAFYTPSATDLTSLTDNNTLWYNSIIDEVDLMIHDGTSWVGYQNGQYSDTDTNGPIISSTAPELQSNGSVLVDGDIWIDTSNLADFPRIYRFNANLTNTPIVNRWVELDTTDQTSENGVLFADARWSTTGGSSDSTNFEPASIRELLQSDYLDPDAPDPSLYPRGMVLWNLRRSGFNVKRFVRNYIDSTQDNIRFNDESMENYYPHRWVTESANQNDGSGSFGQQAQRKVVIQALQQVVNSNDEIRDSESRQFNLLATPGYPELIGEMITLNFDRGVTAFIVGDSPVNLEPNGTSLNTWATNQNLAVEDNDQGLVSRDEYLGIFYPWGFTSDNFGNNVVVPPSHMVLRTIILSDQVSFPWFAPAGIRRGGITNATAVGYVDREGEFVSIALNEGQRDILYENNVNPLTFLSGAGLVNYGQKTRARGASALDRINVARLVIFLRSQLSQLAKPYIFEQNDKITRDEIKQATESLLLELVGQRALFDFLVVCDESNNTPARIDRNELYLDIAIEPVKSIEFIYIPLRLKNTGEIAAL